MGSAQWREIRPILELSLEQPSAQRPEFVAAACRGNAELEAEILSLIAAYERAGYLENPADPWSGRRIGPWLLGARLGEGGMGAVYTAARADGQYDQRAALKLVSAAILSGEAARRFWNERQLLARLDHPHIAHLLDGGTTSEGVPYLVMEYVEGLPIDRYCEEHRLPAGEILTLFRAVCSAVEYAHGHLVVHRDIKPGNVLVTAEGVPKLLDFGIAKLLDGEREELTQTSQRPMTPAYASPEQIRGDAVTTATDVYSLGVLLYRLLTGDLPQRARGAALERAILEEAPPPPSQAASGHVDGRQLRGDLDAIVLTALQKDPARRYPSVESLSDDIDRYLRGLPVRARRDTAGYRASRFVRRHRAGVAVSVAAVAGLMGATVVSLNFARQARIERRAAEARFNDVRSLANFFLFDFDDAVRSGSTAARRSIVEKGLEYLSRLSHARNDVAMMREAVAGYCKVGDIQGNLFYPNLGDVPRARTSYERAAELARAVEREEPASPETRRTIALCEQKLGEIAVTAGSRTEALEHFRRARELLETLGESDRAARRALALVHARAGFTRYQNGHFAEALEEYEQTLRLATPLGASDPKDLEIRKLAAMGEQRTGELLAQAGSFEAGLERLRAALFAYQTLARENPGDASLTRSLSSTHLLLGEALRQHGRSGDAILEFRVAVRLAASLADEDPQNTQYQRDMPVSLSLLASLLNESGGRSEAHAITIRILASLKRAADSPTASEYDLHEYCRVLVETPFADLRNPQEARRYAERVVSITNGGNPRILDLLARAYEQLGDERRAIEIESRALSMLPASEAATRKDLEANLSAFRGRQQHR